MTCESLTQVFLGRFYYLAYFMFCPVSEKWKWKLVAQSCPTLCDPMDCSLPGSFVHRIFQARTLEWVAISFPRGSSQPRARTWVSHIAGGFFTVWATRKDLSTTVPLSMGGFIPGPCLPAGIPKPEDAQIPHIKCYSVFAYILPHPTFMSFLDYL